AALQSRLGTTTVYVTHDQSEAMTLGDRVAVLSDGRLQQCDTPRALYVRPANMFVAGFIGSPAMNLCQVACTNGSVRLGGVAFELPRGSSSGEVVVGLRPESREAAASRGVPRGGVLRGCRARGRARRDRGARPRAPLRRRLRVLRRGVLRLQCPVPPSDVAAARAVLAGAARPCGHLPPDR